MEYNNEVKLALDIGTTKICAIISKPDATNTSLEVLGIGKSVSDGLNRGVITNIDKTVKSIKEAIEKAEQQSGLKASTAVCGIAGDHIQTSVSHHVISISNPQGEIRKEDVDRLIEEASKIPISSDRKILHLFPQEYIIDGQDKVYEPIGMSGMRMEANINIITGLGSAIENIYKCVRRNGIEVEEVILEPFASSYSVLSEDEKDVGVALVDIGGGTTDIAIFCQGVIKHINVIAMGGNLLTDDVRAVLQIVRNEAERIKKEFGHCFLPDLHQDTILQIPGVNGRNPKEIRKSYLTRILEARMREMLTFVDKALEISGYKGNLGAGVVLTGGSALMPGIVELAEDVLRLPVKLGVPTRISSRGLAPEVENPIFATSVGLALHGFRDNFSKGEIIELPQVPPAELEDVITDEEVTHEEEVKTKKKKNKEPKENSFRTFFNWLKKVFDNF